MESSLLLHLTCILVPRSELLLRYSDESGLQVAVCNPTRQTFGHLCWSSPTSSWWQTVFFSIVSPVTQVMDFRGVEHHASISAGVILFKSFQERQEEYYVFLRFSVYFSESLKWNCCFHDKHNDTYVMPSH